MSLSFLLQNANTSALAETLNNICDSLGQIVSSPLASTEDEAKDCLDFFNNYNWVKKPNADEKQFQSLLEKGNAGEMSEEELDDFMEMVSDDGDWHVYYALFNGQKALAELATLMQTHGVSEG
ncbi:hypothetical protein [Marinimicrobium sp. ABcell2]|uniref:hypothetical protein n=1 Tax=Marinimicrobium sp. ABcell2 TaxID=3069751 RepID=UPI0027B75820|nr:hypothetical protein [Marinimicrobium sp. ABcell2]MDQ2077440.1 hypothetical protein [Marinimicrobium sp. ABcell2]